MSVKQVSLKELHHCQSMYLNHLTVHQHILKNLQSPPQIVLIESEISAQRNLDNANRKRYEALHTLYFNTFAYMVSVLKDLCDDHPIQGLSCSQLRQLMNHLLYLKHTKIN